VGEHITRSVFNLARNLTVGWPETFLMSGTPDNDLVATRFYINSPAPGFLYIDRFASIRSKELEFCELDFPFDDLAKLPGEPVDPFLWMKRGDWRSRIAPLRLGPSPAHGNLADVRLTIRYTGLVPPSMRGGDTHRLVAMFIGARE
jgi:hypothetical protein